ncbi:MAG: FHA domain-containing protein [Phycisphaerales bacterium]|nr:FHA domain-containing protein [Phycisphaerales bacterium]
MTGDGVAIEPEMSNTFELVSVSGAQSIHHPLDPARQVVIGRSRECDLVMHSPQASRHHAQLSWEPTKEAWMVLDLGSRGGTSVNGERIPAGLPCRLEPGDQIGLPDLVLLFRHQHRSGNRHESTRRLRLETVEISSDSIDFSPVELSEDLDRNRLASLLAFSQDIHDATDEDSLFQAVLQAVADGTSFEDGCVVSPPDEHGDIDLLAAHGALAGAGPERFSFTLLRMAASGRPARFVASSQTAAESLQRLDVLAAVSAPLKTGDAVASVLYVDTTDVSLDGEVIQRDLDFVIALAQLASVAISNLARSELERRFAEARSNMFEGTVRALASAIDAKDPYTRGHSDRVSWLSEALARTLGHDQQAIETARVCGQVHDVGKIGVPEAVLVKPDRLTDEEFDQVKQHPDIGHRILHDIPAMKGVLGGVKHHHERWDGKGYPDGLAGESIPELGRLVAVVDAFDAMRSARAYRDGRDSATVLEEIRKCAGTQFDPRMAEAFLKIDLAPYDAMLER